MSITPPLEQGDRLSVAREWRELSDHGDADGKSELLHLCRRLRRAELARRSEKRSRCIQQFPDRTNVVFVRPVERDFIELRIWERGVGETTASGTCSCAGAVAAMVNDKADRDVRVLMEGGEVRIKWRPDGAGCDYGNG